MRPSHADSGAPSTTRRVSTGEAAATTNQRMVFTATSGQADRTNGVAASTTAVATSATCTNTRRRPVRAASQPHRSAPGTPAKAAVEASTPTRNGPPPSESAYSGTSSDAAPTAT
jgi:hypothetical protein